MAFITYHFLGCFADWRVPRSNILLHLHPSWSLEHEAGIRKHNRGLKLSAALASTIEAWSSGQIRLEKQKLYRLALLPPSRLAAFLNTGSFLTASTYYKQMQSNGEYWKGKGRLGWYQAVLESGKGDCLKGEGDSERFSIICHKRNPVQLWPAQKRYCRL